MVLIGKNTAKCNKLAFHFVVDAKCIASNQTLRHFRRNLICYWIESSQIRPSISHNFNLKTKKSNKNLFFKFEDHIFWSNINKILFFVLLSHEKLFDTLDLPLGVQLNI